MVLISHWVAEAKKDKKGEHLSRLEDRRFHWCDKRDMSRFGFFPKVSSFFFKKKKISLYKNVK